MLIIDARDSDSIDKALRKYKKKFDKAGVIKELRRRQQYIKPSVERREQRIKAAYSEKIRREQGLI